MDRLGVLREVVLECRFSTDCCVKVTESAYPEHVGILEVSLRVTLLSVDEVRELGGVTNEEHRGVVENPVKVALLGLDLDGETWSQHNVFQSSCQR